MDWRPSQPVAFPRAFPASRNCRRFRFRGLADRFLGLRMKLYRCARRGLVLCDIRDRPSSKAREYLSPQRGLASTYFSQYQRPEPRCRGPLPSRFDDPARRQGSDESVPPVRILRVLRTAEPSRDNF